MFPIPARLRLGGKVMQSYFTGDLLIRVNKREKLISTIATTDKLFPAIWIESNLIAVDSSGDDWLPSFSCLILCTGINCPSCCTESRIVWISHCSGFALRLK